MRINNPFVNLHPAEIPLEEYKSKFAIKTKRRLIMPNKEKFYTAINMIDEIMDWMIGNSHGYINEIEEEYNMDCDEAMQTICTVFMETYDA